MLTDTIHELHHRRNDGIDVALLWDREDGRLFVTVDDARTGDSFVLGIGAEHDAMDVFHHPYAYASYLRVEVDELLLLAV